MKKYKDLILYGLIVSMGIALLMSYGIVEISFHNPFGEVDKAIFK